MPVRGFPYINKSVQKNKLIIKIHTRKKKITSLQFVYYFTA